MLKFDHLTSAQDLERHATADKDRLLVQLLTTMTDRIVQLEARLDKLSDLTVGDQLLSFDEQVLSAIESNSHEAFSHIEAEIEEKLEGFLESHSFNEAVSDAVRTVSGLSSTIEEILDGLLHDAIIDAIGDPEDIVRKGLRSIL
jgi:hypothetical protein